MLRYWKALRFTALLASAPLASPVAAQQPAPAAVPPVTVPVAAAQTGRITGRVVDRETGRPLQGARVSVVGIPGVVESDLDGRYRTPQIPVGLVGVRAAFIGYQLMLRDSIRVIAGQAVTVDFVMTVQIIELEDLSVESTIPASPKSDAGLLSAQQAAAGVSDGISAEAISRSPDSDGGDVIRRVTGVTVFDKKFVVVRGLNERYSNTTLNGADLPSPEPLKKVAPLDIFPASLLESIVTTKTATPDKPGDFAGGLIEVRTKEFPENFVFQAGISQGFNSQSTFRPFAQGPRSTADFFGFGDKARRPDAEVLRGNFALSERAMESFRNVWTGRQIEAMPNLGLSVNIGGQVGESRPLGFTMALTYGNKRSFIPDRLLAFTPDPSGLGGNGRILDESTQEVEWGGIANFSWRPTGGSKFGWKNLYTRGAEEVLASGTGYSIENNTTYDTYSAQYIERSLLQTQLTGEHVLGFLWNSRFDWKGTLAWATRKEPDQRRADYLTTSGAPTLNTLNIFQLRDLEDRIRTGQADLTVPWSLRRESDATLKFGGLLRDKPRTFTSGYYQVRPIPQSDPSALALEPEQTFAPENVGSSIEIVSVDDIAAKYESEDDLTAFYGMADLPLLPSVRLVSGLRVEHWRITIYEGSKAAPEGLPVYRRPWDYLWSGNLTFALSDQMNFRLAGFRSVTRPDPRELVPDRYTPVGSECDLTGDTTLVNATILNADARWEYYPRGGEVFAISGFYKKFTNPLVEVIQSSANSCTQLTANGEKATSYGLELEARRSLDFLPGFLRDLSFGANATILKSEISLDPVLFGGSDGLELQGQSPLLLNASLSYQHPTSGTSASVLYNYFDTRIARYGSSEPSNPTGRPENILELGRYSLDAKIQQSVGPVRVSLSATNLTNQQTRWVIEGSNDKVFTRRFRQGTSWSLGMTYDIF